MKKIIFVFVTLFSLFFLISSIQLNEREIDVKEDYIMMSMNIQNNGVKQSIIWGIDENFIIEQSSQKEFLTFCSDFISKVNDVRNEYLFSYALIYSENPIEDFKLNKGIILTDVVYNSKLHYVGFDVIFTSMESWAYYNNIDKNVTKNGRNIFYDKIDIKNKFIFSNGVIEQKGKNKILLGEKYKNLYLDTCKSFKFGEKLKERYSPDFIYDYAIQNLRLKSDSTYKVNNGNVYHHIWKISNSKLNSNNEICMQMYIFYYSDWYLTALLGYVLFLLVLFCIKI